MSLPRIPADKATHFIYGAGISLLAVAILHRQPLVPALQELAHLAGALLALLAGILVEFRQKQLNAEAVERGEAASHGIEAADVVATFLGGASVWLASLA